MAMHLEKSGIKLSAIYRPLNNIFLNPVMEHIRKSYICKIQIKKGISGTKELLKLFKKGIIYRDIGMRHKAQKVFQTLVNFYPDSEYKAFAEQEIHNI